MQIAIIGYAGLFLEKIAVSLHQWTHEVGRSNFSNGEFDV
jgi:hypothetical protein